MRVCKHNIVTWPKNVCQAVDAIAVVFAAVYELARTRAAAHASYIIRAMAQTDDAILDAKLLAREAGILRRNRGSIAPRHRPHYAPPDRLEIIQLMRLRGWTIDETADRFAINRNTVSAWIKELETDPESTLFTGITPANKIGDAVRSLVHDIRGLCPEREFGTRSIAMQIVRAGIQLGRSTVQQVLREKKPVTPKSTKNIISTVETEVVEPHRILRPKAVNETWHLDLTTFEFLWVRFYVAAVLDGYSRKLLSLRVYPDAPSTNHVCRLIQDCVRQSGAPRFLVTDHGSQFRHRFKQAMTRLRISVIHGKDSKRFNGKVERFFRTLKLWQRVSLLAAKLNSIQRRLDSYQVWYNTQRPMMVLDTRTPNEAWGAHSKYFMASILARDPQPRITVTRKRYRKDPHLFVLDVQMKQSA